MLDPIRNPPVSLQGLLARPVDEQTEERTTENKPEPGRWVVEVVVVKPVRERGGLQERCVQWLPLSDIGYSERGTIPLLKDFGLRTKALRSGRRWRDSWPRKAGVVSHAEGQSP